MLITGVLSMDWPFRSSAAAEKPWGTLRVSATSRGALSARYPYLKSSVRTLQRFDTSLSKPSGADRWIARELDGRGRIGPAVTKQSKPLTGPNPWLNRA
jgi:hypothetical protein